VRVASPRERWHIIEKAAKGGSGGALMTDGERKRKCGSVSHDATQRLENGVHGTTHTQARGGW
jgi:hypothetical protein